MKGPLLLFAGHSESLTVARFSIVTSRRFRRLPQLRSARSRDGFLGLLEQTRRRYRFVVVGYDGQE